MSPGLIRISRVLTNLPKVIFRSTSGHSQSPGEHSECIGFHQDSMLFCTPRSTQNYLGDGRVARVPWIRSHSQKYQGTLMNTIRHPGVSLSSRVYKRSKEKEEEVLRTNRTLRKNRKRLRTRGCIE